MDIFDLDLKFDEKSKGDSSQSTMSGLNCAETATCFSCGPRCYTQYTPVGGCSAPINAPCPITP